MCIFSEMESIKIQISAKNSQLKITKKSVLSIFRKGNMYFTRHVCDNYLQKDLTLLIENLCVRKFLKAL